MAVEFFGLDFSQDVVALNVSSKVAIIYGIVSTVVYATFAANEPNWALGFLFSLSTFLTGLIGYYSATRKRHDCLFVFSVMSRVLIFINLIIMTVDLFIGHTACGKSQCSVPNVTLSLAPLILPGTLLLAVGVSVSRRLMVDEDFASKSRYRKALAKYKLSSESNTNNNTKKKKTGDDDEFSII